jgi:hypothetical protein
MEIMMAKKTAKSKAKPEEVVEQKSKVEVPTLPVEAAVAMLPAPIAPPADFSQIHVCLSAEELITFANLMTITAQTYQRLALAAIEANDEVTYQVLSARQKLSSMLANKLAVSSNIGEPISRDVH